MNVVQLFGRLMKISLKKEYEYRFEMLMLLVQLVFNVGFTLIFWNTLFQFLPQLRDWSRNELLIYTAVIQLGEGISGVFFGFRDMPERILEGELDKYLVRPMNPLISLLFENVSVFYFLEQIIVGVAILVLIYVKYQISVVYENIIPALLILIAGVIIIQLIIGAITMLSFWIGRIDGIRMLFEKLVETKEYPLNLYPNGIQKVFTYLIPVFFVAYYPTGLLLGKLELQWTIVLYEGIFLTAAVVITCCIWRKGLRRYEANGG